MNKNRLEAFSDGVMAIIITIMVLEIKTPHEANFKALGNLIPVFISYVLSFIYVGIYWNNHHHMIHTVKKVTGSILWANLYLLFWLSLVPFATAWIGKENFAPLPMLVYGVVLLMCALAYFILQYFIIKSHGPESILAKAIEKDYKGKLSVVLYLIAALSAYFYEIISGIIYLLVAIIWLIPDKRIESKIQD